MRINRILLLATAGLALIAISLGLLFVLNRRPEKIFDAQRAYQDVLTQVGFGPRIPESEAHARTLAWMQNELKAARWQVEVQETVVMGYPVQNLVARRNGASPQIILGAHYDSRLVADRDQGSGRDFPVPGANDGASGVAILLELARTLPSDSIPVWLVFFDAEDNGNLPGWNWLLGSRAFVATLTETPQAVIIVDMVGDADLNIYKEYNSTPALVDDIWAQAAALGYEQYFLPDGKYSMLDDHTPFLEAGIPAVDIIDFDYPYFHTAADTADKVSPRSLEIVGKTLWTWIVTQK
jgi:Zn-dependent M28 family amino/carboxypeptidase